MSYSNGMTAHVWAQQNKERGKSGNGNMSFEGRTLYSYSTPIGRFVDTVDGRRALPVGVFQLEHVAPNGTLRAGCHLIQWPEIELAARAAGVLDISPADTRQGEATHA
jgi:hypothetical protein